MFTSFEHMAVVRLFAKEREKMGNNVCLAFLLCVHQGFRTLEDIRTKAHLTNTQKIGLKHYDDFLDRMPREEAAAIEKVVIRLNWWHVCM